MKILVLSAMTEEIDYLVESFKLEPIDQICSNDLYMLKSVANEVYILNSGIGKVASSITTATALSKYKIDKLISIGTSGALTDKTNIGDLVNGEKLVYHDADVTAFGYEIGQLPKQDRFFETTKDQFWNDLVSKLETQVDSKIHVGAIATGDQFINSEERKQFIVDNFEDVLACEMESTAIIHTAKEFGVDRYVLRSISDKANGSADVSFDKYLDIVCQNYKHLIDLLLDNE